jgi:hypothetical protein
MTDLFLFEIEAATARTHREATRRRGEVTTPTVAATKPAPKRRKRRAKPKVGEVQPTVECGDGWWRLTFPAPAPMLSVNSGNQHWRRTSSIHKTFREAMYVHAKAAKLPVGLRRVRMEFVLRFPRAGRQDIGNYYTHTIKPCVDGLGPQSVRVNRRSTNGTWTQSIAVGYGLIADDTAEFLDGPHVLLGEPVRDKTMPYGQVTVTIADLSCTDVTAAGCPTHGDCTCPDTASPDDRWQRPLDGPRCALHAPTKLHGEGLVS